jgi:hypothetical protein
LRQPLREPEDITKHNMAGRWFAPGHATLRLPVLSLSQPNLASVLQFESRAASIYRIR